VTPTVDRYTGDTAVLLEELRQTRALMTEALTWLHFVYAEVWTQTSFASQTEEDTACRRAAEHLASVKRLIAGRRTT
jgi:hypothetical protein